MANQNEYHQAALTSAQAAHYIGMTEGWLRQQRCHGTSDQPPYVKIGRSVRYLKADLDAWLQARRHATEGEAA